MTRYEMEARCAGKWPKAGYGIVSVGTTVAGDLMWTGVDWRPVARDYCVSDWSLLIRPLPHVRVGLGTIVWRMVDDIPFILLHKRKGGHQPGVWCSPGGHLEHGESFLDCAFRELLEECGPDLTVANMRFWDVVNTVYVCESKHYVTLFCLAEWVSGEACVMEPDKCEQWAWFPWHDLPTPLMLGNQLMKEKHPHGPR